MKNSKGHQITADSLQALKTPGSQIDSEWPGPCQGGTKGVESATIQTDHSAPAVAVCCIKQEPLGSPCSAEESDFLFFTAMKTHKQTLFKIFN